MFKFLSYNFNPTTYLATFSYQGSDGITFQEKIHFCKTDYPLNTELLDRALFLCFILIGTSYYKAHPSKNVGINFPLDDFQAKFFNTVYQEGLSQFAFENHLTRADLAHFSANTTEILNPIRTEDFHGILSLQSGGKDSLLTATMLQSQNPTYIYISNSDHYPSVLNEIGGELQIVRRELDREHLRETSGLNGHVPITYIVQSIALTQAIINHQSIILTSIGREGNEAHAYIDDLAVNHQWSKTWPAEQLFAEYLHKYISPDLNLGSPLRGFSELKIAEFFVENCWAKYGHKFSSCNVANYRQGEDNSELGWCGDCAKCANTYLLFAPFLPATELDSLYGGTSLFLKDSLVNIFKGLLGIDGFMKPFECVGEIGELRRAYHMKSTDYPNLPFAVPESNFDYEKITAAQPFVKNLLTQLGV